MEDVEKAPPTLLDGHAVFAIVVFVLVAVVCIHPVHIPVPAVACRAMRALCVRLLGPEGANVGQIDHIVLSHVWTPAIGIVLLLGTRTIGAKEIKLGIIGEAGVEPYDVLIFFISLAYIAVSLDATGLLQYLAYQVCLKANNSGRRLYLLLFGFWWTLGSLAGNDPVILSGTAFLVYLTRAAGIVPPSAWIWAQFVAANISSAVLVSSNPTNLVIANGMNIEFTTYTAYMVLPSIVSAVCALCTILLMFRTSKPSESATDEPQTEHGQEGNAEQLQTISSVVRRAMGATIATDEGVSMTPLDRSHMTEDPVRKPPVVYIPAVIVHPEVRPHNALNDPQGAIFTGMVMIVTLTTVIVTNVTGHAKVYMVAAPGAILSLCRDLTYDWYTWRWIRRRVEETPGEAQSADQGKRNALLAPVLHLLATMQEVFPTVTYIIKRLPLALLPFAIGMFILVETLHHVHFIDMIAGGLGGVCGRGYVGCSFFVSTLGVVLCNIGGTNIGATILLTRVLQSDSFMQRLPVDMQEITLRAAAFSIAFGSNVGALGGTFGASLAGLLWRDDLLQRGVPVSKTQFAGWCATVIIPATVSGVAVLLFEVRYFDLKLKLNSSALS